MVVLYPTWKRGKMTAPRSEEPIRVFLLGDHPVVLAGLRAALGVEHGFSIVGESRSGTHAVEGIAASQPQVIIVDAYLETVDAEDLIQELAKQFLQARLLALTPIVDGRHLQRMLAIGVQGYLLQREPLETLRAAVRAASQGEQWFSAGLLELAVQPRSKLEPAHSRLTVREVEILRALAAGKENAEIAAEMQIAVGTVKNHLVRVYDKLGVHSRVEAALWAQAHGLC